MGQTIFRKTSMDRLKSPEQLNEYIRVASPSVWLILGAVVLLLVGVIVWGVFGSIPLTVDIAAEVSGGSAVCFVDAEDAAQLEPGMTANVGTASGTVTAVGKAPVRLNEYEVKIDMTGLPDGIYPAEITVGSIHPISFVIQ